MTKDEGMTGGRSHFILGFMVCIVGVAFIITPFYFAMKDPSTEARTTLTFAPSESEKEIYLSSGDYEIWYIWNSTEQYGPGASVRDPTGRYVYTPRLPDFAEFTSLDGKLYKRAGTFTLQVSGICTVSVWNSNHTLYITPPFNTPISMMAAAGLSLGGVGIIIFGIVLILTEYVLHTNRKIKAAHQRPELFPPQQKPPTPPST